VSSRCSRDRRSGRRSRISRWGVRWSSRRDGKPIRAAARRDCASRSSATSSTATSAVSGPHTCRTSSIMRRTGPPSARRRRRTGGSSIWCSPAEAAMKNIVHFAFCISLGTLALGAAPPAKLTGGNGTLYIGGWPNKILIIDEATEKVAGAIDVATGSPRGMFLSKDRKRFYLVNSLIEQVEIVDVAARKSLD